jgi:hypothetical protein
MRAGIGRAEKGMTQPVSIFPQPCDRCGGFSRRKVICWDCNLLFHENCIEDHDCNQGFADEVTDD